MIYQTKIHKIANIIIEGIFGKAFLKKNKKNKPIINNKNDAISVFGIF